MGDDIAFDKSFDLAAGQVEEIMPGLRRLLADNPSPLTFKGTVSYIIGRGRVAILDPGPEDDQHITRLLDAVRGETVTHVFVSHTHRAPRALQLGESQRLEASADLAFRPDLAVPDGESVTGAGWTLEAVATPGHTANHMAYAYKEGRLLFSGDHVMAWSTPVVAPPDGAMGDYMASLHKLAARPETTYFPGHGGAVRDAPLFVQHYIRHRQAREASILRRLAKGTADIPTIVRAVYIGLDPRLVGAAGLSVLAHLEDLFARGLVATDGEPSLRGVYRLVGA